MPTLLRSLAEERYTQRRALNRDDVLRQARTTRPDVVLLDVTVPRMGGLEVCRRLKDDPNTSSVGLIILTGRAEQENTMEAAFALGADDCVAKPFSPRELVARVAAVMRRRARAADAAGGQRVTIGALEIDRARFQATLNGRPVDLTLKEFELLATLAKAPGRVFSRRELLDLIWRPDGFVGLEPRTVDVHMARLRRKFRAARLPAPQIDTVRGVGYRFRDPETS